MTQELIALSGKKGAGKNTAAKILVEKYDFKEVSMAAPLKKLVGQVFDIPYVYLEDPTLKETPFETPMQITQERVYEIVRLCSNLADLARFKKLEDNVLKRMSKRVVKETKVVQTIQGGFIQQKELKKFNTPRELLQFVGTDLIRELISPYFWPVVLEESIKNEPKIVITDVRFYEERQLVSHKGGLLVLINREYKDDNKDKHASENSLGGSSEYDYILSNNGTPDDLKEQLEVLYKYEKLNKANRIYKVAKES